MRKTTTTLKNAGNQCSDATGIAVQMRPEYARASKATFALKAGEWLRRFLRISDSSSLI